MDSAARRVVITVVGTVASGTNHWVIKTQELSLINVFLCFHEQRGVNITKRFWKKLVMCAEEACQMAVHTYQYTAGGVPVQCIIKYHVAKTNLIYLWLDAFRETP